MHINYKKALEKIQFVREGLENLVADAPTINDDDKYAHMVINSLIPELQRAISKMERVKETYTRNIRRF